MRTLIAAFLLTMLVGCGNIFEMDPATTVILKISGISDDAEGERVREKAVELVEERSTWQKNQMSQNSETLMIKLSPVKDFQGFADRIKFGKVTAVEGNIIQVKMGDQD